MEAAPVTNAAPLGAAPPDPKPKTTAAASKQFEALLIGQMLRSAHESGGDSALSGEEDSSSETMWDLAAQHFAQVMANNGGLGLAKMIEQGLKR